MDSRPPPPQGMSTSFLCIRNESLSQKLRPIVLSFAFLGAIWTLFSGIGFFRNAHFYSDNNENRLKLFSIIIGAMYMGVLGIELFGAFAAFTQKVVFVRIFAYLSALVVLVIAAVGLIRSVIHFSLKHAIIDTCTNVATGETVFFPGLFGPVNAGTLDHADASDWCNREWDRDSWSEIVAFLVTTVLAAFFCAVTFAYLRQVLDPTSPVNVSREPTTHRMGNFPSHYNPPYPGFQAYNQGTGYPTYAPPPGPPPRQNADAFVPPYEGDDGKPPGYIRGDDYKGPGYDDAGKKDHDDDGYAWNSGRTADGPSERDVTSRAGANPFI